MKSSVILTGFMGTGKTVVGSLLARRLGLPFLDTDRWIEQREHHAVKEIFQLHGEFYFRQREREAVRELAQGPPKVIATGGGTVAYIENRLRLREYGVLIWLRADLDVILQRIQTPDERPMLDSPNPKDRARELLKLREASYRDSDASIDTSLLTPEEVADEIIRWLEAKKPFKGEPQESAD